MTMTKETFEAITEYQRHWKIVEVRWHRVKEAEASGSVEDVLAAKLMLRGGKNALKVARQRMMGRINECKEIENRLQEPARGHYADGTPWPARPITPQKAGEPAPMTEEDMKEAAKEVLAKEVDNA